MRDEEDGEEEVAESLREEVRVKVEKWCARERKREVGMTGKRRIEMYRCILWKPFVVIATVSIPSFHGIYETILS